MVDRRTTRLTGFAVAVATLLADQLVKYAVTVPLALPERGVIPLIPFFDLRWVQNYGVSMGFLTAEGALGQWLLVGLTAAITIGVATWAWIERRRWDVLALGLVLGGALGNILDRVRLGYVVDYADLHFGLWRPFYIFNLADAAISIGVAILVLRAILVRDVPAPSEDSHA
ncbi:MAG: signal peptidase II [Sphingomonas fennica]